MDVPNFLTEQPKEVLPDITLTTGEVEKLERTIKNMSDEEKRVIVTKIPTDILENEIYRRLMRDIEYKKAIRELTESMEEY